MNLRRWIQLIFFIVTISVGVRFYIYINRLLAGSEQISRPSGVEGFLPISALMGLKKLILTGHYDIVHPAGLTILMAALLVSIVFKKSFCSTICPVGFASEMISSVGLNLKTRKFIFHIASIVKYIILFFFVNVIVIQMNIRSLNMFISSPYNILSDAKMLNFFMHPSRTTLWTLGAILLLTLIITNFWCRFLCPYGALTGLLSTLSPFKVKRDKDLCTGCRKCTSVCPMHINVHKKNLVHSPECFGCYECVKSCPETSCLKVTRLKNYRLAPLMAAVLFSACIITAMAAGRWNTRVPQETYRTLLQKINTISH